MCVGNRARRERPAGVVEHGAHFSVLRAPHLVEICAAAWGERVQGSLARLDLVSNSIDRVEGGTLGPALGEEEVDERIAPRGVHRGRVRIHLADGAASDETVPPMSITQRTARGYTY